MSRIDDIKKRIKVFAYADRLRPSEREELSNLRRELNELEKVVIPLSSRRKPLELWERVERSESKLKDRGFIVLACDGFCKVFKKRNELSEAEIKELIEAIEKERV